MVLSGISSKNNQTAPYLYMKQGKRNMKKRALHKSSDKIRNKPSAFTPESWADTLLADREMPLFYSCCHLLLQKNHLELRA